MRTIILELIKKADIVFPGEDEASFLLNKKGTPEKTAEEFLQLGCQYVALKLGERGCYVVSQKETGIFVPSYKIENIVDTIGAGDGFAAGFLAGF